ncbi:MAG: hypothetical protein HY308_07150 [Gammaproteobacteria bacterium]|nr:hypothetical protein [Gammaproteobacteria bacterium]
MHVVTAALLSIFSMLTGCSHADEATSAFVRDLQSASAALKVDQELRMDVVNKGEWSQMFIFSPYTPLSEIEASIKLKASSAIESARISERDDINLLVFLKGNNIQVVAAVPRYVVDLSVTKNAQPLSRNSAVFKKVGPGSLFAWTGNRK